MQFKILEILDSQRLMTLATLRADGWPQATMVGYANEGLRLYFIVSRRSQKFQNILCDARVSIAIGADTREPSEIRALSMSARVAEVTDAGRCDELYALLLRRRPEYAGLPRPDARAAAILRATPKSFLCWTIPRASATPTPSWSGPTTSSPWPRLSPTTGGWARRPRTERTPARRRPRRSPVPRPRPGPRPAPGSRRR